MSRGQFTPIFAQSASLLLRYPTAETIRADAEIRAAVAGFPGRSVTSIESFLDYRERTALLDLEQEYVRTFDTRRRFTLNVSYCLYGDTRRRGIALLRLKRLYAAAGLVVDSDELPDHLPLMLEFAAFAPADYGARVIAEHRVGLELLRLALKADGAAHHDVLDAVCSALPRLRLGEREAISQLAAQGPPDEQVGLEPFAPPEVMPTGARQ